LGVIEALILERSSLSMSPAESLNTPINASTAPRVHRRYIRPKSHCAGRTHPPCAPLNQKALVTRPSSPAMRLDACSLFGHPLSGYL
jgi:hypothetical protein